MGIGKKQRAQAFCSVGVRRSGKKEGVTAGEPRFNKIHFIFPPPPFLSSSFISASNPGSECREWLSREEYYAMIKWAEDFLKNIKQAGGGDVV